jgi:hypothetical protein
LHIDHTKLCSIFANMSPKLVRLVVEVTPELREACKKLAKKDKRTVKGWMTCLLESVTKVAVEAPRAAEAVEDVPPASSCGLDLSKLTAFQRECLEAGS